MFAQPMARAVCTMALAVVLAAPVGTAGAEQSSAGTLATAKELIVAKGGNALYEPIAPGVIEKAKSVFLQANPMLGKDLNEVAAKLRAEFAARTAEILNDAAKLYAARFKEQELKDALAFYKSPLGRKLLAEEPRILDESMRHAQSWADRLSEEVISKMRTEMKKRGHEI
jgi:uncharacterized protein